MKRLAPVAVAGMGCICAPGPTLDACMHALFAGQRHPALPTRFSIPSGFSYPVFEIPDSYLAPAQLNGPPQRTCQLALTAAHEAVQDAGLAPADLAALRVGVCLGTNVGGSLGNETLFQNVSRQEIGHVAPLDRFAASNPTAALMETFDTNGPFQTVVNACSAGNDAIGIAAGWIDAGWCDLVLAGGADELYQVTYVGFKSLFINSDAPCRPFDLHRKGLNLGEGAAIFVLASPALCQRLNVVPRGYVLGYGAAADAHHFTHPRPDGAGLKRALDDAFDQSGLTPQAVAFINVHGTGTQGNDQVEATVLNERFAGTPFLSTKGYTGHTLGAAGPVEAAFTLACLERQQIPKTAGFATPDPALGALPTTENSAVQGDVALSQTLAFGGSNSVLILGKGARAS
jgi:3-oxoacyl-[acyl-carrier-protein] synthase II